MAKKTFKCWKHGCDRDSKLIKYVCEQVPIPTKQVGDPVKRKPPLGVVGRMFIVECPEHGQGWIQEFGHHVTTVPKKGRSKPGK